MSARVGGSSVAERNLDRITVAVGLVWFACIVVLGPARRSSPASRPSVSRPHRRADLTCRERPWQVATRSGAAGSARGRWVRPSAASPRRVARLFWCSQRARDAAELRRDAAACPRPGTARAAGCRRARTGTTRRPPRTEPYKTHLAYVRERRSDADGEAILAEALKSLRDRGSFARPRGSLAGVPLHPASRRSGAGRSDHCLGTWVAASLSRSHVVDRVPVTPAAGACSGPAPERARPTAPALSAPETRNHTSRAAHSARERQESGSGGGLGAPLTPITDASRSCRARVFRKERGHMGVRSHAEHQHVELGHTRPGGRRRGELVRVAGGGRVDVRSVRAVGGRHRVNARRVQGYRVQQRLAGLRLVALRVARGQEPLVAPPDVQPSPVDRVLAGL